jgi:hypothetical protein
MVFGPEKDLLGRYLYKGVIQEKDIVACENGQVTFRYQDSQPSRSNTEPSPTPSSWG